jgi:NADPH:quinone reductase-like Zn-dependent oxidoreductase
MLAWRVHEFGPPESMRLERVPIPQPGPGEVLVKVRAAGVGPWDGWIRSGKSALLQTLPLVLGSDVSGVIQALGQDVPGLRVGDEVYGVTNPQFTGGYAEYAVASARMVARKPTSLSHVEAASVPIIAVTAWQALFEHANSRADDAILIHGAGGNVGAYALQLARRARLRVVATCSRDDFDYVRSLGAQTVYDSHETFENHVRNLDAVLDLVGGETQARSFAILRRGGKLISAVSAPDQDLATRYGVDATFFLVRVETRYLEVIAGLVDADDLTVRVGTTLPLKDAREAHFLLEGGRPRSKGKVVLAVESA